MLGKDLLVYIDGGYYSKSEAKISVYDHGFLYGDGVFEGIRSYGGIVFRLREHIDRLYRSANAIMLDVPLSKEDVIEAILGTLRKNHLKNAYIRLVVTRGIGDLGLDPRKCSKASVVIITEPMLQLYDMEKKEKGVRLIISWIRRDSVDATTHEIKSLNYLNSILSKIEANNVGADEAVILDNRGFICEATAENIFVIKNERIMTPPSSSGALPGITAEAVKGLAAELGYQVIEREITPTELYAADEAFLTGTGAGILCVREVNKRSIGNGKMGPITRRLVEEFDKITKNPNEGIPV